MADGATPALGLSIGATNLAAVTADQRDHPQARPDAVSRSGRPRSGVPSENPRLDEPGLVITDFVDRVGRPGRHRGGRRLACTAARRWSPTRCGRWPTPPPAGAPCRESVAVTYPAHWGPTAVDALGRALSRVSEWSTARSR